MDRRRKRRGLVAVWGWASRDRFVFSLNHLLVMLLLLASLTANAYYQEKLDQSRILLMLCIEQPYSGSFVYDH